MIEFIIGALILVLFVWVTDKYKEVSEMVGFVIILIIAIIAMIFACYGIGHLVLHILGFR